VAILEGDETFLFKFSQYLLFFADEVIVISVLKILEGNPLSSPETEVKRFQPEVLHGQGLCLLNRKISCVERSEVLIKGRMVPPSLIVLKGMCRRTKTKIRGVVPVFLIVS